MKYEEPEAGEWVFPRRKGYKLRCCDCGLVHRVDFKLEGKHILFRVFRDNRATAAVRRYKSFNPPQK